LPITAIFRAPGLYPVDVLRAAEVLLVFRLSQPPALACLLARRAAGWLGTIFLLGNRCGDRRETASGNPGIDVVGSFSPNRVLLTRIMPNRSGMHSPTDFHRQQGDYQCRHGIVNATTSHS